MDINKSFRYVMDDKQWLSKLLIGVLMSIFSFLILPALILQGYLVKIIRHVMGGNWDSLPEWDDWGKLLKDGFFVTVAQIVYTLPFMILMFFGIAATGGMASLTNSSDVAAIATTGGGFVLFCLVILFAIAFLFLTPALLIQYAIKDDFAATFRIGEVADIIRNHMADILIAFLVTVVAGIVLSLLFGILAIIPCLGWIAAAVIGLAVGPYITFVTGHLYGQIAAKVIGNKAGGSMTGMA